MDQNKPKSSFLNTVKPAAAAAAIHKEQAKPQTDTTALYGRFPHLKRIDSIWGTRECRELLNTLMSDSRGDRQGFPVEHARTLFALLMEHDNSFPQFDSMNTGVSAGGVHRAW